MVRVFIVLILFLNIEACSFHISIMCRLFDYHSESLSVPVR